MNSDCKSLTLVLPIVQLRTNLFKKKKKKNRFVYIIHKSTEIGPGKCHALPPNL